MSGRSELLLVARADKEDGAVAALDGIQQGSIAGEIETAGAFAPAVGFTLR